MKNLGNTLVSGKIYFPWLYDILTAHDPQMEIGIKYIYTALLKV
jgi:hypothetical protein